MKTGAVAQYPAARVERHSTEVRKFLDCGEQRYRDFAAARRRWVVDLAMLDETEMATLARFFDEQQGRLGVFEFEDPWTGTVVTPCRFGEDQFVTIEGSESRCAVRVTVEEVAA